MMMSAGLDVGIPMEGNLEEGDHHCGNQPDVDHLGVGRRWQCLSLADETEKQHGHHVVKMTV